MGVQGSLEGFESWRLQLKGYMDHGKQKTVDKSNLINSQGYGKKRTRMKWSGLNQWYVQVFQLDDPLFNVLLVFV